MLKIFIISIIKLKIIKNKWKDFVYLSLTLEIIIWWNEERSRYSYNEGLSERGSFNQIRISMENLAYPKFFNAFLIILNLKRIIKIINL
jgi:hypothetical protein